MGIRFYGVPYLFSTPNVQAGAAAIAPIGDLPQAQAAFAS
jgi:hypothetical protein